MKDWRYAFRLLHRAPAHSLVVIAVLAVGIGANIVTFGYYKTLTYSPIPGVHGSGTLHAIGARGPYGDLVSLSYLDYSDIRDRATSYTHVAGSSFAPFTIGRGADAQRAYGEIVTGNYFSMLGVGARHGRVLGPSDDRVPSGHPVVVLSHAFWQRDFDGDPAAVGRSIHVNNVPLTIVGVAGEAFHGTVVGLDIDFFVPLMMQPSLSGGWNGLDKPHAKLLLGLARPRPGVTLERARAELAAIGESIAAERPETELRERAAAILIRDSPQGLQTYSGPLVGLMGVIAIILLVVVCANVAGLVLVRTLVRRGEIAARLAMGASRTHIVRLLLIESLLLAVPGAWLGLQAPALVDGYLTDWQRLLAARIYIDLDGGAMVAAGLVLACLSAVLSGLLPGVTASRVNLSAAMNDGLSTRGPSATRLRAALVVCQVAMAVVLMVGATLVARSLGAARRADIGFDPRNVASVVVDVGTTGLQPIEQWTLLDRLRDDLRAMDGVEAVSLMRTPLLMVWDFGGREFIPEGHTRTGDDALTFPFNIVSPGHFQTLRIPLLAGRDFRSDESADRVAIVNETLARQFWGSPAGAVGKQLQTADWTTGMPVAMTVIGVARDIKYRHLKEQPHPYVYMPHSQAFASAMAVHVRSTNADAGLLERVRQRVRQSNAGMAVLEAQMLIDQTNLSFAMYDIAARVLRIVGLAAVALAALGIYGIVAYTVKQSAHEIGIRMAVGAERGHIVRRYIMGGARLSVVGAAIGVAIAVAGGQVLSVVLFNVSPTDVPSIAMATSLVVSVAIVSALLPAWRASRVDPLISLRRH